MAAYVFVKIEGEGWTYTDGKFQTANGNLSFTVDSNWTALEGHSGVFYKAVSANSALTDIPVINGNKITVASSITQGTIGAIVDAADTLTFTAYAIQQAGFEENISGAWAQVKDLAAPQT